MMVCTLALKENYWRSAK